MFRLSLLDNVIPPAVFVLQRILDVLIVFALHPETWILESLMLLDGLFFCSLPISTLIPRRIFTMWCWIPCSTRGPSFTNRSNQHSPNIQHCCTHVFLAISLFLIVFPASKPSFDQPQPTLTSYSWYIPVNPTMPILVGCSCLTQPILTNLHQP